MASEVKLTFHNLNKFLGGFLNLLKEITYITMKYPQVQNRKEKASQN